MEESRAPCCNYCHYKGYFTDNYSSRERVGERNKDLRQSDKWGPPNERDFEGSRRSFGGRGRGRERKCNSNVFERLSWRDRNNKERVNNNNNNKKGTRGSSSRNYTSRSWGISRDDDLRKHINNRKRNRSPHDGGDLRQWIINKKDTHYKDRGVDIISSNLQTSPEREDGNKIINNTPENNNVENKPFYSINKTPKIEERTCFEHLNEEEGKITNYTPENKILQNDPCYFPTVEEKAHSFEEEEKITSNTSDYKNLQNNPCYSPIFEEKVDSSEPFTEEEENIISTLENKNLQNDSCYSPTFEEKVDSSEPYSEEEENIISNTPENENLQNDPCYSTFEEKVHSLEHFNDEGKITSNPPENENLQNEPCYSPIKYPVLKENNPNCTVSEAEPSNQNPVINPKEGKISITDSTPENENLQNEPCYSPIKYPILEDNNTNCTVFDAEAVKNQNASNTIGRTVFDARPKRNAKILQCGLDNFAKGIVMPFFVQGYLGKNEYKMVLKQFVHEVVGTFWQVEFCTEKAVYDFLKDQFAPLIQLLHKYLGGFVSSDIIRNVR